MKLEAIKKEKEPECLNQRSSSKQNYYKMSIRLYQTTAHSIDRMANYLLGGQYEEGKECI